MLHFDLPKQQSSIIKVLGVGGGGGNAVNYMYNQNIEGVDFIICNTDAKALEQSRVPNKIQLGPYLTQGLGAGADPQKGKNATEESLEEIKKILEVNTKMVFICAGMGGGTGTGGAPIIAKMCKELGILTVGIVTTPFAFEGPRRKQQAELGVREMEPHVDTLLVISNDKMRLQYGNLKMQEAFGKADNVLATAAKCITDIINSKGHVVVDFADVCTVMKNGGVAILGSSSVEGEDRAQRAIEEALTSPLLNDNEIRGAKWVLINVQSGEGDYEFTMDEIETISTYLRTQTGDNTDVIIGMGLDGTLDKKISLTLIATGFTNRDPFAVKEDIKPKELVEKVLMELQIEEPRAVIEPVVNHAPAIKIEESTNIITESIDVVTPELHIEATETIINESDEVIHCELDLSTSDIDRYNEIKPEVIRESEPVQPVAQVRSTSVFLNKPMNVYSTQPKAQPQSQPAVSSQPEVKQVATPLHTISQFESSLPKIEVREGRIEVDKREVNHYSIPQRSEEEELQEMELVIKDTPNPILNPGEKFISEFDINEADMDKKRKAAERIKSFGMSMGNLDPADPNNEFEKIPTYIRRNKTLFNNTLSSVENYYNRCTVQDNEEGVKISTINTFLNGEKPD